MDGRETDDDDTLERHTDTNKLTGHTASWAATHPEWTYTSLKDRHHTGIWGQSQSAYFCAPTRVEAPRSVPPQLAV